MKIFVNDTPVFLIQKDQNVNYENFDQVLNAKNKKTFDYFVDDILIFNTQTTYIAEVISKLTAVKKDGLNSLTFVVTNIGTTLEELKSSFKFIQASGGVVKKEDRVLLIKRLGKWDLPKGKLEKGETEEEGAAREVEEETGVKVSLNDKIGDSWHTYIRKEKLVLKQTHWFRMTCIDDSTLAPQTDEDIETVEWMTPEQVHEAMIDSYRSIRNVWKQYLD